MSDHTASGGPGEFSLVLGGPLYRGYLRARLLRPQVGWAGRRVAACVLLAWLPLLLLTGLAGTAWGGVAVPFLHDLDAQVRLLIAIPLLIAAEPLVHERAKGAAEQFVEHGLIAPADTPRFRALIADTVRWRNSSAVEIALLAAATVLGYTLWKHVFALKVGLWYDVGDGPAPHPWQAAAGWWHAFVSLNLLRFLLFRWYYRIFIWYVFLWRVSRFALRLNPLHPDRCGGLGFVGVGLHAFVPVLLAHTAVVAGAIGDRILHEGARLPAFEMEIVGVLVLMMAVVLLPALFFIDRLIHARLTGWREYGGLSMQYVDAFREKWMSGRQPDEEPLIGSGDIQSLADLANAHGVLQEMRVVPLGRDDVIGILAATALPFLPLVLTMVPVTEIIHRLIEKVI